MSQPDRPEEAPESSEADAPEPLNRAERRAQRRGKRPAPPDGQADQVPPQGRQVRQQPAGPPRRASRRGNR